jgi:hypothetical protein
MVGFVLLFVGLWLSQFYEKRKKKKKDLSYYIVTDLINALPGTSSVNTVKHATKEETVFSVDPTDAPIDWLDSDHVICVYCATSVAKGVFSVVLIDPLLGDGCVFCAVVQPETI